MMRIVISEFMDEASVAQLAATHDVHYDPELVDAPDDLMARLDGCPALIVRNRTQVRGALLEAASSLRVLGRLGVGLDNIDTDACAQRGITVIPATGANAVSVAEYVVAGALMLRRGAYFATDRVTGGQWPRMDLIGREVMGATMGLVGFGMIAREVASRGRALGMRVIAHDPMLDANDPAWSALAVAPRSLEHVLENADVISLHVPLTEATRDMINAETLGAMKPEAVLINAARGAVVDEAALAQALRGGRLAGAMLDVFASEPLPADSVLVDVPNLVLTPHIAGLTAEANTRTSEMIAREVAKALARS